jgi:hypothetical protein
MGLTGGKSGGKNAMAAKPNLLNALRVQNFVLWPGHSHFVWTEPSLRPPGLCHTCMVTHHYGLHRSRQETLTTDYTDHTDFHR